jgi:hypothetical protein
MEKIKKSSPLCLFYETISFLRLANRGNTEIVMGEFRFYLQSRRSLLKYVQNQGEQFPGGAFEEVVGKARGEAGGFQVDLDDEGVPFLGDGLDVAGRGHLAPL